MIAFNFSYFQPTSIKEAIELYKDLKANGLNVFYYSGGTEFISRARRHEITCDAVIDIKSIPETNLLEWHDDHLITGACCTLSSIIAAESFPLLSNVARGIATQTERNKITLGGNSVSNLPYKETIMPFLLADSDVVIASENGKTQLPINEVYQRGTLLNEGEFIVQFVTKRHWTTLPFIHLRRTKQSHVNYPIVSIAAIQKGTDIRIAMSGLTHYPFRSTKMENVFQSKENSMESIVDKALDHLPETPISDLQASEKYRYFVLKSLLNEVLTMKGAS